MEEKEARRRPGVKVMGEETPEEKKESVKVQWRMMEELAQMKMYINNEIHDIAVQMGASMGEVRGKGVDGRYPCLEVGRRSWCLQAHDTLLETGTPGRVEDRALPPMEREPEQSNTGRKAGSMQDDGQDERL